MTKISSEGMMEVSKNKKERAEALSNLMSKPFSTNDQEQLATVKKYLDDFEFTTNQMYLYQGLAEGLKAWGASFIIGRFLPIPDFANYLLTACLYCGTTGLILKNFKINDFHHQLEEMKSIYTWCLKGKSEDRLNHPEMQRMIEVLAPLCTTEFMCVWDKVTQNTAPPSVLETAANIGYKFYSFFVSSPESPNKLKELKIKVEQGDLKVGILDGTEKAARYFATNTHFRAILMEQVQAPINYVKGIIPEVVTTGLGMTHAKTA